MCVVSKQSFSNLSWSKFSSLAPFVSATAPYSSNTCTSSCMFSLHIMFGTSREGSRLCESRDCCGFSDKAAKSTTSRRLQFRREQRKTTITEKKKSNKNDQVQFERGKRGKKEPWWLKYNNLWVHSLRRCGYLSGNNDCNYHCQWKESLSWIYVN